MATGRFPAGSPDDPSTVPTVNRESTRKVGVPGHDRPPRGAGAEGGLRRIEDQGHGLAGAVQHLAARRENVGLHRPRKALDVRPAAPEIGLAGLAQHRQQDCPAQLGRAESGGVMVGCEAAPEVGLSYVSIRRSILYDRERSTSIAVQVSTGTSTTPRHAVVTPSRYVGLIPSRHAGEKSVTTPTWKTTTAFVDCTRD